MALIQCDLSMFEAADTLDRGIFYLKQNHFAEAIVQFDRVLQIEPHNPHARWDRAIALLSMGDYVRGMPEHDSAWAVYDWQALGHMGISVERILALPLWHGEPCKLIMYHEMGFGDAIMLLRFLPELAQRCHDVTLVVHPALVSLMQGYGVNVVCSVPEDVSGFDARVSLFNSVFTLGHSLDTIPSAPYIPAKLNFSGGKMGIAWSGNSRKEFKLSKFLPQIDTTGYDLYALQQTGWLDRIEVLQSKDFKETAELMMTLDCIVTIDTAAAHLAGAIGHPNTHLLLPFMRDWRWWNAKTWYPSINVYPQETPDSWAAPFAKLNEALRS